MHHYFEASDRIRKYIDDVARKAYSGYKISFDDFLPIFKILYQMDQQIAREMDEQARESETKSHPRIEMFHV